MTKDIQTEQQAAKVFKRAVSEGKKQHNGYEGGPPPDSGRDIEAEVEASSPVAPSSERLPDDTY